MPTLKLYYFDINGGRGETARLALTIGKIPFEDIRIPFAEWPQRKDQMLYGAIPVLEVEGKPIAQSATINRYVGKLAGLYPDDPWQAALCDEIMDSIEELTSRVVATFHMNEEQKKSERVAITENYLTRFFKRFEQRLIDDGAKYLSDNRLTVADLHLYVWIKALKSGQFDYIPTDIAEQAAPRLAELFVSIDNNADIKSYYAQHGA